MRKWIAAAIIAFMFFVSTQAAFADANPNVTIVNPVAGATIYSDNLLVSVKIAEAASIKVYVTQEFKVVNGDNASVSLDEYQKADASETASVPVGAAESFTSANDLSFYTKKVENVKPGIYQIKVNTVGADDAVLYTNSSIVEIKAKDENTADPAVLENQQSGAAQFLKNLLKIIFKE